MLNDKHIIDIRFNNTLQLPNITRLFLGNNSITSLDNVKFPNTLKTIFLNNNQITEIKNIPLSCIPLFIRENPIKKVFPHIPNTMIVDGVPWWEYMNKNGQIRKIFTTRNI